MCSIYLLPPKCIDLKIAGITGPNNRKRKEPWKIKEIISDTGRMKAKCHVHQNNGLFFQVNKKAYEPLTEVKPSA